jgi:hypothetical protein
VNQTMQTTTPTLELRPLPHDAVAVAAYFQWIKADQPAGRDEEFWLRAEEQLRKTMAPQSAAKGARPETDLAAKGTRPASRVPACGSRKTNGPKVSRRLAALI